jgi:hypothetical protein
MKKILHITIISLIFIGTISAQNFEKIVLDKSDELGGYYLAMKPYDSIKGVVVLFPTRGYSPETVFVGTKIQNLGWANGLLTIAVSAGESFYADSKSIDNLNRTFEDVKKRYNVKQNDFIIGGFGGGGMIGLRYTEYCYEKPIEFPIKPKAVFAIDPAVDLINLWHYFEREITSGISDVGIKEAKYVLNELKKSIGDLENNVESYKKLTPFYSKSKNIGNEQFLKDIPVRLYYDVDLEWYLENKLRSAYDLNFLDGSELIKRLRILGNENAEFIQATGKGFRFNGERHPHSWSILNEVEFIKWTKEILNKK